MAVSARRRMTYSLRSKARSSSMSSPRSMNIWRTRGMQSRAVLPSGSGFTGTVRQPITVRPSEVTIS